MSQRIVSSRVPIRVPAHDAYRLLEDLENHRALLPGVTEWGGDRDTARYRCRLGPGRIRSELRVVERIPGMRVGVETVRPSPVHYRRWYKIQADERTCICEISMECEMSRARLLLLGPLFRLQMNRFLRHLKAALETPTAPPPAVSTPA